MTISKINLAVLFTLLFISVALFFSNDVRYNFPNSTVTLISILVIFFSIESIRVNGLKAYNVFSIAFFFPLYLNTLVLSDLQMEKQFYDLYFLLLGPLLFSFVLYFFERTPVKKVYTRFKLIDINYFYLFILICFLIIKLYIGSIKGFKIAALTEQGADLSFNAFAIPGFSGVAGILQWMILILSFSVNKRLRILGITSLILFNSVLGVNRGDLTRTITFLLLYQIFELNYSNGQFGYIFSKYKSMLIKSFLFFLVLFVVFGQVREIFQDREVTVITDLLQSKIDSILVAWLYSYFALGYDVLLLYVRAEHFGHFEYLTAFLNPSEKLSPPISLTLWPFNQTTVLRPYIASLGYYYFIFFIIKGVLTGLFLRAAKSIDCKGLYVFIMMFLIFSFFSEYFLSRSVLLSMFLIILIFPFFKVKGKDL